MQKSRDKSSFQCTYRSR